MGFSIGDRIAHPMHGAGVIENIVKRSINGVQRDYYVLRLPAGDMVVMIPVEKSADIGVRPIVSPDEANGIIAALPGIEINMTQNWNKRYRENMVRIKSGDLLEVAAVIKSLMTRDKVKGLSTGEKKMLSSAKQILISEIVFSKNSTYDEIEHQVDIAMFDAQRT